MIKKFLYTATMIALLTGCGSDDPIKELTETPILKPVVDPDKNTGDEKPVLEKDPVTEPEPADLTAYFDINNTLNISEVIKSVSNTSGEKSINGKKLNIIKSEIETRNDEEGRCILNITGIINKNSFSKQFTFEGFAKKPKDYFMATRANVKWKENLTSAPENSEIAFDELYRLKQTGKFTARYLSKWVDFYSSNPEGNDFYIFSEEDIAMTQITDVSYDNGYITFIIDYKGVQGNSSYKGRPSLAFDKNEYYKRFVTLNADDVKQYYMRGVYENLESFYGNAINIADDKTFIVELVSNSKSYDNKSNSIRCRLSLTTYKDSDHELAQFEFDFYGFKPLSDLMKEWSLATRPELNEYMKKRLSKLPDGNVIEEMQRYSISNWIRMAQMSIKRDNKTLELYRDKIRYNNIDVDAWIPVSRRVIHSDILLIAPHFELISAEKRNNKLTLKIQMVYVNETSIKGLVSSLDIAL